MLSASAAARIRGKLGKRGAIALCHAPNSHREMPKKDFWRDRPRRAHAFLAESGLCLTEIILEITLNSL
jgi:hypothetical protein